MPQEQMPESLWIKVEEGHHQRYISVYSVPATEHTEYVPASRLSALAERVEKLERTNEQHRETLRGILAMARDASPDVNRIALWCTDSLSGYTESLDATLLSLSNARNSLAERVERAEALLKECGEYARKTSFCQEDDGWHLRAKESADLADRISSFLHDGTKGEGK